jgi:hypothetical protein
MDIIANSLGSESLQKSRIEPSFSIIVHAVLDDSMAETGEEAHSLDTVQPLKTRPATILTE